MLRKLIPLITLLALILAACGSPSASTPATPKGLNPVASAAQGQQLFQLNCGECHGKDSTGTDEAPAVLGHTADEITKQVRTPEGDMKAIAPAKLSDADLAQIVQYVTGLGGADAHPDIKPTDEERVHLMAAYESIKDHDKLDRQTATNHLQQAGALASGDAADMYNAMITWIKSGKAGNARHELKDMLGLMEGMQ
jgi:mono/diheme cytochrome c family protein